MASWAGFSEEELKRLKKQNPNRDLSCTEEHSPCPREALLSYQPPHEKKCLQDNTRGKRSLQAQNPKSAKQNQTRSTCSDHALSNPKMTQTQGLASMASSTKGQKHANISTAENLSNKPEQFNMATDGLEEHLSKIEMELKEKSRLDQLQLEQRIIEEKNKRKKAMLAKAIAERSKKTEAEAVKLKRIQKQLQALDDLVSTDIGILRTRIEHACVEFSQAKKRYDRAESEFVTAKLDLHKKTQIKEQLAEHLCTIIQQNELRKAKRLEEIMQQLEVETDEERLELEIEVDQMLQQQETEAKKLLMSTTEKEQIPSTIQETSSSEKEKTTKIEESSKSTTVKELSLSNEVHSEHELKSRNGQCSPADSTIHIISES